MIEMVSGGFSSRIRRISICAGRREGVNNDAVDMRLSWLSDSGSGVKYLSGGGISKSFFHVSGGVRCWC